MLIFFVMKLEKLMIVFLKDQKRIKKSFLFIKWFFELFVLFFILTLLLSVRIAFISLFLIHGYFSLFVLLIFLNFIFEFVSQPLSEDFFVNFMMEDLGLEILSEF